MNSESFKNTSGEAIVRLSVYIDGRVIFDDEIRSWFMRLIERGEFPAINLDDAEFILSVDGVNITAVNPLAEPCDGCEHLCDECS